MAINSKLMPTDRVCIIKTGSNLVDGKSGTIIGLTHDGFHTFWIVELDEWIYVASYEFCVKAISLPEICLVRIEKETK